MTEMKQIYKDILLSLGMLCITVVVFFKAVVPTMQTTLEQHPEITTIGPPGIQPDYRIIGIALLLTFLICLILPTLVYWIEQREQKQLWKLWNIYEEFADLGLTMQPSYLDYSNPHRHLEQLKEIWRF